MKATRKILDVLLVACGAAVAVLLWRDLALIHPNVEVGRRSHDPAIVSVADAVNEPTSGATIEFSPSAVVAGSDSNSAASPPDAGSPPFDPYELLVEHVREQRGGEAFVRALIHAHERIADSQDDPSWTRPAEQELSYFIHGQPEAAGLEISSITCRSVGCEVQILGVIPSGKSGAGPSYDWRAIVSRLNDSPLAQSFQVEENFIADVEYRTAYVTTLRRVRSTVHADRTGQ